MTVRFLGAVLLVGAACYIGYLFCSLHTGRQRRLECFLQLIRFVENEISCFQTPLDEIYRRFEGEALEVCGFLAVLREKGMRTALKDMRAKLCFSDEEWRLLIGFAGELGKSYREEQLRACAYYRTALEACCQRGRESLPSRLKLCRSLAVTGGLLLVVMLL